VWWCRCAARPERPEIEIPFFGDPRPVHGGGVDGLSARPRGPGIKAVVLEPAVARVGWGSWRRSGTASNGSASRASRSFAYLRIRGRANTNWPARRPHLPGPQDQLYLRGAGGADVLQEDLDKIGSSVEIEHAGKYKDFGDMFTRPDMSRRRAR